MSIPKPNPTFYVRMKPLADQSIRCIMKDINSMHGWMLIDELTITHDQVTMLITADTSAAALRMLLQRDIRTCTPYLCKKVLH